jgi:CubicO group peptidase (beta-lactamase class C family)
MVITAAFLLGGNAVVADLRTAHPDGLQAALRASAERSGVVGASAAVWIDGDLQLATYGLASLATGYPIEPDTLMQIGSVTKLFTATLVMQLVDEGRIDLDAPFTRYMGGQDVAFPAAFDAITVRMLLDHSNGINGEMFPQGGHDEETIVNGVRNIAAQRLLFPPGTQASYSNGGAVLAGYLVERVLGMDWYQAVRARIFDPLGMAEASVLPENAILHRTSVGHLIEPATGQAYPSPAVYMQLSYAPAGVTAMMSARDLVTFGVAHLDEASGRAGAGLLSQQAIRSMRSPSATFRGMGARTWGLGWEVGGSGTLSHGGGGSGVNAMLVVDPGRRFVAAIMTNTESGRRVIAEVLGPYLDALGADLFARPHPTPISSGLNPDDFVGVYEDVLARYVITRDGEQLMGSLQLKMRAFANSTLEASPPIPLERIGQHDFTLTLEPGMGGLPHGGTLPITFLNSGESGAMQHLAVRYHLYARVD